MTDEELAAIESRANAATLGPWEGKKDSGMVSKHDACDTVFETGCGCCTGNDLSAEDAAFIASARSDVPALIAGVLKLRAEREKADKALTQALRSLVEARNERNALVRAIDEHCVTALDTTFERGGDAKQVIHHLMFWSQEVGEYFAKQAIDDLRAERDALRKVDDAMVERACIARFGVSNWQESGETEEEWRAHYREVMRVAIDAALAVQP